MSAPDWAIDGRDWPNREASRFVAAGGLRWHVQLLGEGPPLLLLHGTGAASHSWRDVAPALAGRFRVIVPDLPGHGFTGGRPRGGSTLAGMAGAVGALLAALETVPQLVAGHSAGVAIAAQLAFDGNAAPIVGFAPALVPFPGMLAPLFSTMAGLLLANPLAPHLFAQTARSPARVARFLGRSTGSALDARGVELYRRLFRHSEHCRGAVAMMADWDLTSLSRRLPRLAPPLHVAHGTNDSAIPLSSAERAAAIVARGSFEAMPSLGHLAHEERPQLAADIIRRIADREGVAI
jgi:magnesium chelatase accessory protein